MLVPSPIAKWTCLALLSIALAKVGAVSLEEIRQTPDLTPVKFASFFRDFDFDYRAAVQPPDVFLSTRSGDCDDFSTLAAAILKDKGYTPRLIAVRMPKIVHVVCYVEETGSYLDYDLRQSNTPVVKSGGSIEEIAAKVAKGYRSKWSSASEFTFEDGMKRLVSTVLPAKRPTAGLAAIF